MLVLALASWNFPISSVGRAFGQSNSGPVVRISSGEVDLSVTFGVDVGTGCVLDSRIQL